MARDYAQVNVTIWGDPDWRLLPPAAQHLYLTLWTSPTLTYCGTHDWRPARITGLTAGWTRDHIETVARSLVARHFLVIDHDTEEVLIRSWTKFDGLMRRPRMAIACINAYSGVASPTLRGVIVSELHKIKTAEPALASWADERVVEVLTHPSVSAKDLPAPDDPLSPSDDAGFAMGLPQNAQHVCASVCDAPPPAPAPAPLLLKGEDPPSAEKKPRAKQQATALPADWSPTPEHAQRAKDAGLNLNDEATALRAWADEGNTSKSWNSRFTRWLIQAEKYQQPRDGKRQAPKRRLPPELEWMANQ